MINFIPPIRASLFVSLIYLICFQFFLQSGSYAWLYLGNIVCFICSVLYIRSLNNSFHSTLNMLVLTAKGVRLSLLTAILSLAGAAVVFLLNFYLFAGAKPYHLVFKSLKESLAVAFANSFLVNLVAGSLAAFFTAGFVNERNYQSNSRVLASVKS